MPTAFAKPSDYRSRPAEQRAAIVACGTRVTVGRGILVSDYRIVAEDEAEPRSGRIAAASALGRALLGARVGEAVEYQSGGRVEEIRILAIFAG